MLNKAKEVYEKYLIEQETTGASESVKTISKKDKDIEKVNREVKRYTEEEHLEGGTDVTRELYERIKRAILALDNLEIQPKNYT